MCASELVNDAVENRLPKTVLVQIATIQPLPRRNTYVEKLEWASLWHRTSQQLGLKDVRQQWRNHNSGGCIEYLADYDYC